jgi:hypothetical protein
MRSLLDTRVFDARVCAFLGHHHRRRLLLTASLAAPEGRLTDPASNTKTFFNQSFVLKTAMSQQN